MADEATIIELLGFVPGRPVRLAVNNNVALAKGTLVKIAGFQKAAPTDGDGNFFGITVQEKKVDDGQTQIAVYTHGIFGLTAASAITAGNVCDVEEANKINDTNAAGRLKAGGVIALETAATDEVIACLIGRGL